jgi:hypothetical protein
MRSTRFGFLLWGWAMLLVVLVSAAPDGAAPGSREIGSAFDPATPSVAIGPQQPREVVAIQIEQPPVPAMSAGGAGMFLPIQIVSSGDEASGSFIAHRSPAAGDPRSANRAHGARAPPLA